MSRSDGQSLVLVDLQPPAGRRVIGGVISDFHAKLHPHTPTHTRRQMSVAVTRVLSEELKVRQTSLQ